VPSDDLRQRFEALETEVLPLTGPPATEAIRRRGRRRQRTIRVVVLLSVVLLAAVAAQAAAMWTAQPDLQPVAPPPTTRPAVVTTSTTAPATSTTATSTTATSTTAQPTTSAAPRPTGTVALRADGLGVTAFGAAEQAAMRALQGGLGPPQERGSWSGATPFGTCPGPVRAVRWGRLYVLFTNGPTRYSPQGRWHLFAWQVDQVQRTVIDPQYSGPTPPPNPPPLRGYSPRTATGIGFGSTVAELRAVYGSRLRITFGEPGMTYQFTVGRGATIALFGSLSGGTAQSTVTWLAAGAVCGE
jgi:hypothetical protein